MPRFDVTKRPDAIKPLLALSEYVKHSGLEPNLIELVLMRVSQLNGCAYCLDMHSKDARAAGETEQRLYLLQAWRVAPFYSPRERAALAWCEALTQLSAHDQSVPDALYEEARAQFDEKELVDLTLLVSTINAWNRFAIAFRKTPA
jgi:AhpD family alkylhydroperoxidase